MTPVQRGRSGHVRSASAAGPQAGPSDACAATTPPDGLSAYEAARAARIAQNAARLAALGIPGAAQAMAPAPPRPRPPAVRRPRPTAPPLSPRATRALRPRPPPRALPAPSAAELRHRRPATAWSPSDLDPIPRTVVGPFTTRCGTLTIHSLGRLVHASPDESLCASTWWSSAGARFRHAYTAGYSATRHRALGGRDFKCEVALCEGTGAPVFRVTDLDRGRGFTGPSPTRPWTAHCIQTGTGVRVSGPLFYGFTHVLVQAALSAMVMGGGGAGQPPPPALSAMVMGGGGAGQPPPPALSAMVMGGGGAGQPPPPALRSPSLGSGGVAEPSPSPSPPHQQRRVRRRAAAA